MIDIETAKQKLGEISLDMTDEQIKGLIQFIYSFAEISVSNYFEDSS